MSNQDAINKYRADALVASEFAAFRQRWAIGIDIPVDPETGRPIEPFKPAVDRLWTFPRPDPEDPNQAFPQVGEFAATDLEPYKLMIETEVGHISSISRIPYHFFLGQPQAIPPSGESLKSSEAGLVRKVGRIALHLGEGWEEVMRLCLLAMGDLGDASAPPRPSGATPRPRTRPCARTPCSSSSRRGSSTSRPRRSSWATRPSRCARCASGAPRRHATCTRP